MAEKKKKKKPMQNMPQRVTAGDVTVPARAGSKMIRGVAGALSGVNQTLRPDPKLTKKGK